jgi:hypothetical protein
MRPIPLNGFLDLRSIRQIQERHGHIQSRAWPVRIELKFGVVCHVV